MKLRIIAGALKGRIITIPEKHTAFRPTGDRLRESVASILSPLLYNARIADLCAGSGAFGFEMVSRGAKQALFVEQDRHRCNLIREHAEKFSVAEKCTICECTIASFCAQRNDLFDIIYFDPPYDSEDLARLLPSLGRFVAPQGTLVYERRRSSEHSAVKALFTGWETDIRTYGATDVCIFKNRSSVAQI